MAVCNNCDCKVLGECMSNRKAKCKECGSLYCDECFDDGCEIKGDWMSYECDCGEVIWRKEND